MSSKRKSAAPKKVTKPAASAPTSTWVEPSFKMIVGQPVPLLTREELAAIQRRREAADRRNERERKIREDRKIQESVERGMDARAFTKEGYSSGLFDKKK